MFGVLAINKPAGMTSRDVVNRIQRIVRPAKVGHTGTLDPLATGLLLVAIGPATRLVEYAHEAEKEYVAEFQFGASSETLDTDSQVQYLENPPVPERWQIEEATKQWIGQVEQTPPKFSAIHIDGVRAHELARRGADFEIPKRQVTIHAIDLLDYQYPICKLRVRCGTGTYIRTLGSDIANQLGTATVMSRLERTAIAPLRLDDACDLDRLSDLEAVQEQLLSPLVLIHQWPQISLTVDQAADLRNGRPIQLENDYQRLAALDQSGRLVALLKPCENRFYRSLRVFPQT